MGEFADMDCDRMVDEGGWFRGGRYAPPGRPHCNRCGKGPFSWLHTGKRWALHEGKGKLHECDPADDFEVLTG